MALEIEKSLRSRALDKLRVQLVRACAEGHVHVAARIPFGMGNVELAVIEHIVNELGALALYLFHCRNAAYACKPVEHETEHVNAPAGRSVDDRQPGRRHVFLSAGIDKAEFRHVNGL